MNILAIDLESGRRVPCEASNVVSIPVLGFANEPKAEWPGWLLARMADCLDPVRHILAGYSLTFDQEMALYDAIPPGVECADQMDEAELRRLIAKVIA